MPSPPIDVDEVDEQAQESPSPPPRRHSTQHSSTRPSSPQAGSKCQCNTADEEQNGSDVEDVDVQVSKALKVSQRNARPKAGDFDKIGKELVLSAANRYRALLTSQGAFLNSTEEMKLIKKSWKLVNAESGVTPFALTPSIVTIVSH